MAYQPGRKFYNEYLEKFEKYLELHAETHTGVEEICFVSKEKLQRKIFLALAKNNEILLEILDTLDSFKTMISWQIQDKKKARDKIDY